MKGNSISLRLILIFSFIFVFLTSNLSSLGTAYGVNERTGAWVDSITVNQIQTGIIEDIQDGLVDLSLNGMPATVYPGVAGDASIDVSSSNGFSYELSLNPAVFNDTERLNPFSNSFIRESMNWLIDREYLNQLVYEGVAAEKYFPITTDGPDYQRYAAKTAELENLYHYNYSLAESTVNTQMISMGAENISGIWYYRGSPVEIVLLIRSDSDGLRRPIGDYVADQLELLGFTTQRSYVTASEASPIWAGSDPAEGNWHIYTGAWSSTQIDRDEGDNFHFFMHPDGYSTALANAYNPSPEFKLIMEKLAFNQFSTLTERDELFVDALERSMQFAVRIWLLDGKQISLRRATTTIANNMAAGAGSSFWPFTIRFKEIEGGNIRIGQSNLFLDAWNPVAGSYWAYDQDLIRATMDYGLMADPHNGLFVPQRVESAVLQVTNGLPVQKTLDWVDLEFTDVITVPGDAWADWNAATHQFVTAQNYFAEPETVLFKSTVTYPQNLFDSVSWHDGSPLTIGDFIYAMILKADRAQEDSPIYDGSALDLFDRVVAIRITSTDPLVIETYHDSLQLDAESGIYDWWPTTDYGPIPWHVTALAAKAEADGSLAFSAEKSAMNNVVWTNYLDGPTLSTLSLMLPEMETSDYIPYSETLSQYISTQEADSRWQNITSWFAQQAHFWIGTGPFYIDGYDWAAKTLTLTRFADFPDPSDKWDVYQEGSAHPLSLDFLDGAPGSTFTVIGQGYPAASLATIYINWVEIGTMMTDSAGGFVFTITLPADAEPGLYVLSVLVNPAGDTSELQSLVSEISYSVILTLGDEFSTRNHTELDTHVVSPVLEPLRVLFLPIINQK